MSENIDVRAILTAEDHASAVLRRFKRQVDAVQRSFVKPAMGSAIVRQLKEVADEQTRLAAAVKQQASAMRAASSDLNRYAAGLQRAGRAEADIGRASASRHRDALQNIRRQMAFSARMASQRAREERDEERAHRARLGRFEREQRASRRSAASYGRRASQNIRGMDFSRPAMLAAGGVAATGLAARRILISEADTDAAEKNTIAYGGLSVDLARQLREQWAGPLSIQLGATTAQMLQGYTEALKVGIPDAGAKDFSALAIKTSEAWSLPVEAVTDTLGIINQTLTAAGQAFDYDRLHSVANGIQHLAAKMATTPEKMISFLQRGAGAAQLLGMSQEAGLAFGAASTSLGNQAAESGRMFDYVAGRLIRLPQLTKRQGEEGNQARALVRSLGYGSAEQIDRQRRANPDEFLFDFIERFNRIKDPKKRDEAIRFFAGQEWLGEFGRMVTGSATVREAQKLANESKGLDAIGQVWAVHRTKLLFVAKQIRAGFLNVLGEFGTVLSPIARQVGDFFLKWSVGLKNGGLKQKFEAALDGFITGLGFKDITGLLEGIFGVPGDVSQNSVKRWRAIARAFGEGIRSAVVQILGIVRALSSATGSGENLTRWATYLTTWAAAINIASPAFSILGALAAPFLAFGNALAAFLNIITATRLSAAVAAMGGASASTGLLAGLAANPVWAAVGSAIAMGALASFANAKGILAPPEHGFSWRGFWEFLDPGLARRMFGDDKTDKGSSGGGASKAPLAIEGMAKRAVGASMIPNLLHRSGTDSTGMGERVQRAIIDQARGVMTAQQAAQRIQSQVQLASLQTGSLGLASAVSSSFGGSGGGSAYRPLSSASGIGNGAVNTFGQGSGIIRSDAGQISQHNGPKAFNSIGARLMADLQKDFGLTKEQAAGIVGNLGHESAGFRQLQEGKPMVPGSKGGWGYAQWTGPRRRQFEAYAKANGFDPSSYEANYGFLRYELTNTPEKRALAAVRRQQSAYGAMMVFEQQFERAGIKHYGSRQKWTDRAMQLPENIAAGVPTPEAIASGVPVRPATTNDSNGQGKASDASLRTPAVAPVIHVTNTFHGATDPEALATAVQRRVAEAMNWRTHDIEPGLA